MSLAAFLIVTLHYLLKSSETPATMARILFYEKRLIWSDEFLRY